MWAQEYQKNLHYDKIGHFYLPPPPIRLPGYKGLGLKKSLGYTLSKSITKFISFFVTLLISEYFIINGSIFSLTYNAVKTVSCLTHLFIVLLNLFKGVFQ